MNIGLGLRVEGLGLGLKVAGVLSKVAGVLSGSFTRKSRSGRVSNLQPSEGGTRGPMYSQMLNLSAPKKLDKLGTLTGLLSGS